MRPNFKNLEWQGFDHRDVDLLCSLGLMREDPGARKIILIGRLQRELRLAAGAVRVPLVVDGLYGPHTDRELRVEEEAGTLLGPELAKIVGEERDKRNWPS